METTTLGLARMLKSTLTRLIPPVVYRMRLRLSIALHFNGRTFRKGPCTLVALNASKEQLSSLSSISEETLSEVWKRIHDDFELSQGATALTVYCLGENVDIERLPSFVSYWLRRGYGRGYWSPALRVMFVHVDSPNEKLRTIVHELCHAATECFAAGPGFPYAVDEGYALLTEDRVRNEDKLSRAAQATRIYKRAYAHNDLLSFTRLSCITLRDVLTMREYGRRVFYSQATLLTRYILTRSTGGSTSILGELRREKVGTASEPGSAIANVCGLDVGEFARKYATYCEDQAGISIIPNVGK